jgi:NTE family protein
MRALVLSGGGVKGAYQVGILKRLMVDHGLQYDAYCGISVGSLNAAFLAQYKDGAEAIRDLEDLWLKVRDKEIKKKWKFWGFVAALWKRSVFNSQPLMKWVKNSVSQEKIAASGKLFRSSAVCWGDGKARVATEKDLNLIEWVVASASFPVMFSPVEIEGQLWADGGLRNMTPIGEAIRLGATEIDVILCGNPSYLDPFNAKKRKALGLAGRAVEIMADQIMLADLQICGLKNDLAELNGKYKSIKLRVFRPHSDLGDNALEFDPSLIRRLIHVGYEEADSQL